MHHEHVRIGVDLSQGQVLSQAQPGVSGIGSGSAELVDEVGDQHRHEVGRHDPPEAMKRVAADQWRGRVAGGSPHPRAKQQETGQHEEDRYADLQASEEKPDKTMSELAGAIRRVGAHHQQCSDSSHTGKRRDPVHPGGLRESARMDVGRGRQCGPRPVGDYCRASEH